jgi:hypothetical protein
VTAKRRFVYAVALVTRPDLYKHSPHRPVPNDELMRWKPLVQAGGGSCTSETTCAAITSGSFAPACAI